MSLAPIVLFVFKRPIHTKLTLEALSANRLANSSILYIYADGLKKNANKEEKENIKSTRELVRKPWNFKEVHLIERDKNFGLARNITDGVTKIVNRYGKVIVLEDDIITSPGFLEYMNDALTVYENEDKVMHVSGYMFPVKKKLPETFFYNTASCWGWGTWAKAWKYYNYNALELLQKLYEKKLYNQFNLEGTFKFSDQLEMNINNSKSTWAVKWYASFFLKRGFALHPYPSLTNNIGLDNTGENCIELTNNPYTWENLAQKIQVQKLIPTNDLHVRRIMKNYYKNLNQNRQKIIPSTLLKRISKLLIPKSLRHKLNLTTNIEYKKYYQFKQEQKRLENIPRYVSGITNLIGTHLSFPDAASFLFMHNEIFDKEIYKFNTNNSQPYIIDAGANIGLSTIYFKQLYYNAKIIAFEPDKEIFSFLKRNIETHNLQDVTLINKALWKEKTLINFDNEGADGGRLNLDNQDKKNEVETDLLSNYLNNKVDFLKIDIEGAELDVLQECQHLLKNVSNLFIEYHSFDNKPQHLQEILNILSKNNFRYNIQHIGVFSSHPFIKINSSAGMDLQLNIFCKKE